ncbi:hypothetical protein AB6C88_04515 [Vibrio splendidus]
MKQLIDRVVKEFAQSKYPDHPFYFDNECLKVEIRIPAHFPLKLRIYERSAESDKEFIRLAFPKVCPAIESIEIKDPSYRNRGVFNYLISQILELDDIMCVVVQNVHSVAFAHSLFESERWVPIAYKENLESKDIKRMTPFLRDHPEQASEYFKLLESYVNELGETWCQQAIETTCGYIEGKFGSEFSEAELFGIDLKHSHTELGRVAKDMFLKEHLHEHRKIANERGESLDSLYGKTVFQSYSTTKELFNAYFDT